MSSRTGRKVGAALLFGISLAGMGSGQCQIARLTRDSPRAFDGFGRDVAVFGSFALAGVTGDDTRGSGAGAVDVYGCVIEQTEWVGRLLASDGAREDVFGDAVALFGNRAVVGAPYDDDQGLRSGSAYVFERDPSGSWLETTKLTADDADAGDVLGWSIALITDRCAIGAPLDDGGGSVYVFDCDEAGVWTQTAKLQVSGGGGQTGYCVGLSGDIIVAGAPDDPTQGNYAGAAYVYERAADGAWQQKARLLASDGGPFSGFGFNVAISGTTIVCGAGEITGNEMYTGAVYVYERQVDGSWPQVQRLIASDGQLGDFLGLSVSISGDIALFGAPGDDDNAEESGSAYVFRRMDGVWNQTAKLLPEDGAYWDRFGWSVGITDTSAVLGAPRKDVNGIEDAGAAYIFALGPDTDGDGMPDPCQCPGDIDHDGEVTLFDLAVVLSNFGLPGEATRPLGDLDSDSDVDLTDLAILLAAFGTICP